MKSIAKEKRRGSFNLKYRIVNKTSGISCREGPVRLVFHMLFGLLDLKSAYVDFL